MDDVLRVLTESLIQRDKELKASEKKLKEIINAIPEFIVETDLEGMRVFVSDPVERALGYPADYYTGKSTFEGIHPEDVKGLVERFGKGIQERKRYDVAFYRFMTRSGKYILIEATCTPIYDTNHVLIGMLTVNRVIPEN